MIDLEKLNLILEGYKAYFPNHWDDERYKWEAVRHFQDHWNIDAENFGEMFQQATDKTFNLLASGYAYPRGMIINFAKADDEAARAMFRALYDETVDLAVRVDAFQVAAEELRMKHDDGTWRNHYQNTNAISTYFWLRYSVKYGENPNFYNGGSRSLAQRIAKKTGCPVMTKDNDAPKWWPILYTGRKADRAEDGCYIWKLRDELSEALDQVDLSKVALYADPEGTKESQGYRWLTANPRIWSFGNIKVGEEQSYTLYNENGHKRRIFQNFLDAEVGDIVIGYEANPVKILQGAPGVGKTFIAKKLAYAMMGAVDDSRIEMIQFHQQKHRGYNMASIYGKIMFDII